MTPRALVGRTLRYYWRTNAAVVLGVGVAVSALAGALVVGDSVRASLRDLALARLGRADVIVTAAGLFTEPLSERIASAPAFRANWAGGVPVLALEGVVTHERTGGRAGAVQVFGVDGRFWAFNGVDEVGPAGRDAFIGVPLARELGAVEGDALLLRVQKPSTVPAALIQGRRNEPGRAIRLSAARVLDRTRLGEFSPRPHQGAARTLFVPLERLQRELELPRRINMLLVAGPASGLLPLIQQQLELPDLGVRLRTLGDATLAVESESGLLSEGVERGAVEAARAIGSEPLPVLTYLATAVRANGREIPYSLVSAIPEEAVGGDSHEAAIPIWLTRWAADDLDARAGDEVALDYYLWSDDAGLTTATASFTLAGIVPMEGLAVDADLTPEYPGVSTSATMSDWDPPFPVDLRRIRPRDEQFWDLYRTAPKAFVRLEDGQRLWHSEYGRVSSLRIPVDARSSTERHEAYRRALAEHLPVTAAGFRAVPVRADALSAAAGTTDFGEYFTYFSFFLVASSLLLALLFFRLGIEQRAREIGLLAAIGYTTRAIRRLLLAEGAVLALAGALVGVAGALAYSWLIMLALRTWWIDAVGTTDLTLRPSATSLVAGAALGVAAGIACIAWTLRVLGRSSARQLMSGAWVDLWATKATKPTATKSTKITKKEEDTKTPPDAQDRERRHVSGSTGRDLRALRGLRGAALVCAAAAALLVALGLIDAIPAAGAFFGSGTLLLAAGLCGLAVWLRGTARRSFVESAWPLASLGIRNARYRPPRSVLSVALIAAATFLIVSVGAFRRGEVDLTDPASPSGGYALIAETVAPINDDLSTAAGREALNLGPDLEDIAVARFRLRPGDDASCLNLYRPQSPRLLGAPEPFLQANRFTFARSLGETPEERANPWLVLKRRFDDGAVPVVGDATSLAYVFHLGIGDDYVMQGPDGAPLRLRIVGALRDSVLQSELIMADERFTQLFPRHEGFRVFLVAADSSRADAVGRALEDRLRDFGMDVQSTAERLASYHRVENTYLSTFQALGALGLVLGTLGLGTVLLRNVLERARELALLQATGFRRRHLVGMVVAESFFLLACGLALGTAAAAVAIAPAYLERGHAFPLPSTVGLLVAVFAAGLLSTLLATRVVARMPLLEALKNE